jgi:sodium transport system permease protein
MKQAWVIARKEIRDHSRDHRSLASSAFMALMGPAVVLLVSMSDRMRGGDSASVVVSMLSVFALVSSFTGGMDVAMDTTAGERERQTLLPLLLNPVRHTDVLAGKWLAVTAFALGALAVNVLATLVVLAWAVPGVLVARAAQLAVWMALGLAPLAALGAAVNLLVAARCPTTKEAHTALRIVTFVPMAVGMFLVFFPAWISSAWFVPIVGQQLLAGARESVPILRAIVLALVTLAAIVPVLLGITRVTSSDDVLSVRA